jgi:hypothetical protein
MGAEASDAPQSKWTTTNHISSLNLIGTNCNKAINSAQRRALRSDAQSISHPGQLLHLDSICIKREVVQDFLNLPGIAGVALIHGRSGTKERCWG